MAEGEKKPSIPTEMSNRQGFLMSCLVYDDFCASVITVQLHRHAEMLTAASDGHNMLLYSSDVNLI